MLTEWVENMNGMRERKAESSERGMMFEREREREIERETVFINFWANNIS